MVLGAIANSSEAETLLNNLSEADFKPNQISVTMQEEKSVKQITDVSGPLTGDFRLVINKLKRLGISPADIKSYEGIVNSGGVVVTISAGPSTDESAQEMLEDVNASNIQILKEK